MNIFEEVSHYYNNWFQPRIYGIAKKERKESTFESWNYSSQCWEDQCSVISIQQSDDAHYDTSDCAAFCWAATKAIAEEQERFLEYKDKDPEDGVDDDTFSEYVGNLMDGGA